MKTMLKALTLALCACLLLCLFTGCAGETGASTARTGDATSSTRPDTAGKELSVVATIFPAFDWTRQLIGADNDRVALTLLLDRGTDLHSYQPTVEDIYKISTCDLFIYVGGESDKWVPDALAQATNKNMKVICLLDVLGSAVKEEELVEGMEGEHEHDDNDDDHEEEESPEYDEHVWLSLRYAQTLCAAIRDGLIAVDSAGETAYTANCAAYTDKLAALDAAFSETVASAQRKTLLFADRFPFRYLVDDYALTYYAAFVGCSAETEASFETVNFLVGKVDELELPYILKLESSDGRLADTVVSNSKTKSAQILELNSLQSVTAEGVAEGVTYLGVMEHNLEVLKTALG